MDIFIVTAYLGFLLFYGIWQGFRVKSAQAFSLSAKRHGLFVIFAALSASSIGGGFSSGNATEVFKTGIGNIVGLLGFSAGQLLLGLFVVGRARIPAGVSSPGMLLKESYGKTGQIVAGICSTALCIGLLGTQIAAIGWIFNVLIGVPYHMGALIGFAIVLTYSTAGGMSAIITAEVLEFLLLLIGLPLLAYWSVKYVGGAHALIKALPAEHLNPLNGRTPSALISLFLTMCVGEALTPSYIQLILTAKDSKTISRATTFCGLASIPVFVITGVVGLCAFVTFPNLEPSLAMPAMVLKMLPPGIKGIVMAAMLAIVMSSADGMLSSAAIGLVGDVIVPFRQKNRSERELLKLIRKVTLIIGIAGFAFAALSGDVFSMLVIAYSGWAPVMLPSTAAALMGRRIGIKSFLICGACGAATSVLVSLLPDLPDFINGVTIGVAVNLTLFIIFYYRERRAERRRIGTESGGKYAA